MIGLEDYCSKAFAYGERRTPALPSLINAILVNESMYFCCELHLR